MLEALPDAMVNGHEPLIAAIDLPDADDRHVVAAAIRSGAELIVTHNLGDFPTVALAPHGIEVESPDEFVLGLLDTEATGVVRVVRDQAAALTNPPRSPSYVLDALATSGLVRAAAELRNLV